MSYIEDRLTIFDKHAKDILQEQQKNLQEKETYLSGTRFLRLRVLNNLVESTQIQMRAEMQLLLTKCQKEAPDRYEELKSALEQSYEQYVATFRHDLLV